MTERNWAHTRSALLRLRDTWRNADEDTKIDFVTWHTGLVLMAWGIIGVFGWYGVVFTAGVILYYTGRHNLMKDG